MLRIVRKGRNTAYICSKYRYEGALKNDIRNNYGCVSHHLIEEEIIIHTLNYIKLLMNSNNSMQEVYFEKIKRKCLTDENKDNRISVLQKEINDINNKIEQIYDDKLNGIIPQNLYIKKFNEFNDKLKIFKSELDKLNSLQINKRKNLDIKEFREIITTGKLNNTTLKKIFRKIIVYEPNEVSEKNKLELDIPDEWFTDIYNYGGIIFIDRMYDSIGYITNKSVG
jgi:hypothetical protein